MFLAMELGKLQYMDIQKWPINRLKEYLDWKISFDREREKLRQDALNDIAI